jgi:glycosyltransferase involved in cell wall biosynthesis
VYGTGVSVYTKELTKALLSIDKIDSFILFGGSLRRQSELKAFVDTLSGNVTSKLFPFSPTMADFVWNRLHTLPLEQLIGNVDVVHTSDWAEPPARRALKVTTIHDLAPFKFPQETPRRIREVHERKLAHVRAESQAIIVPSNATKDDVVEMGFDATKIHVIYEAVSSHFRRPIASNSVDLKARFDITGTYILSIGTAKRKNNDRLIAAFKEMSEVDHLVIVGSGETGNGVIYTGRVSEEELALHYSKAQAMSYVSLYEGFGLPILEAFKIGTPVVTSNTGSMKEVASGAAVLVDPTDTADIIQGMKEAIQSREKLVKMGFERVKEFSWEKAARETLHVYKQL